MGSENPTLVGLLALTVLPCDIGSWTHWASNQKCVPYAVGHSGSRFAFGRRERRTCQDQTTTKEKIGRVLRQEMRLMMLYPVISILAAADSSCEKGMPLWGYLLYIPLLLRAKWIEIKILRALNEDRRGFLVASLTWL